MRTRSGRARSMAPPRPSRLAAILDDPARSELTARQLSLMDFIRQYRFDHGYSPSIREMMVRMGIRSPNGLHCHLRALKKKGYINYSPNLSRSVTFAGERTISVPEPLVNRVLEFIAGIKE